MAAAMPKTISMLNTLEPMAFPKAISTSFLRAATTDVTSSGRLVPMDTIVRPTRVSLMPKERAIRLAESTVRFPPNTIAAAPPTMYMQASHIGIILISSSSDAPSVIAPDADSASFLDLRAALSRKMIYPQNSTSSIIPSI